MDDLQQILVSMAAGKGIEITKPSEYQNKNVGFFFTQREK